TEKRRKPGCCSLVIADSIDKGRGESYASIRYLANRARMSRRKVFRLLKRLRACGCRELLVSGTGGGGHENTNRYSLNPLPLNIAAHDANTRDSIAGCAAPRFFSCEAFLLALA